MIPVLRGPRTSLLIRLVLSKRSFSRCLEFEIVEYPWRIPWQPLGSRICFVEDFLVDLSTSQKFCLSSESICIQLYSSVWFRLLASRPTWSGAAACRVLGGTSDDAPAIKAALASCNGGGTLILDQTYTIASVLQTTDLNNVGIQLPGTIKLSPGEKRTRKLDGGRLI